MARIGFIGLGKMGRPIVRRLIEAEHAVTIWNRSPGPADEIESAGAVRAPTPAALARDAEFTFTMVADAAALEAVLLGEDGVLSAGSGGAVIDMTTVMPADARRFAEAAAAAGWAMLDAPVAGGPPVAAKGALGMMVGGEAALLDRVRPVLEAFTGKIVHVGPSGQGAALKLVNNLLLATALQATAEAVTFARQCGIDPEKLIEISAMGGAQMRMMQARGPRMIERSFAPDATIDLIHKDITAALALAGEVRSALPVGSVVLEMIRAARARGAGELDMAAIVQVVEALSGLDRGSAEGSADGG